MECGCIQTREYKQAVVGTLSRSCIAELLEGFRRHLDRDRVDRGKVDNQQEQEVEELLAQGSVVFNFFCDRGVVNSLTSCCWRLNELPNLEVLSQIYVEVCDSATPMHLTS